MIEAFVSFDTSFISELSFAIGRQHSCPFIYLTVSFSLFLFLFSFCVLHFGVVYFPESWKGYLLFHLSLHYWRLSAVMLEITLIKSFSFLCPNLLAF